MFKKKKIIILGKRPLPIGGVTIHVDRLLSKLEQEKSIDYTFLENNKWNLIKAPFIILNKTIHIHSSNPYIRFYYVFLAKVLFSKSILTVHGDLNRYKSRVKNKIDRFSIMLCNIPILLNTKSYAMAKKINNKSVIISSFIPPKETHGLELKLRSKLKEFRKKYEYIYCTNAFNFAYDKNMKEIYGIYEIISFFKKKKNFGLIFSDPSGAYWNEFKEKNIELGENIIVINEPHSFYEVLKVSDASIRNTSTDGDSLSVKESLFLRKKTFCTDVVNRPNGVVLYELGGLEQILNESKTQVEMLEKDIEIKDASLDLIKLYKKR
ncbi:hypothetical protein SAMN04489761_1484 [Tenacibaculum sp. MAR_2009_124]|uniref:glycosyltransferase family 1 protein n=1 Tax=Tenacibaculum sp. MAR_2009_124 TaxID=1250059 RepID=UPI0008952757|nr:glycosyltransferase family 1 protein [Tenacibaculum sp. MAR_2009_124]SEB69706.1 hypothetical protein SAMN04489761_1484 [Tenacibaculum sp. MAR_2009_124]